MKTGLGLICAGSLLTGCISVYQTPLPGNQAVAQAYPRAVAGDPVAMQVLADHYQRGTGGVNRNEAEALRLQLGAAEAGNFQAQMSLGDHYANLDPERAAYWYSRLLDAGQLRGAVGLARLAASNRFGSPDFRLALKWAYVADNKYLAGQYEKLLAAPDQEESRRQAEAWKQAHPVKEKK